jgi:hypothetical protein
VAFSARCLDGLTSAVDLARGSNGRSSQLDRLRPSSEWRHSPLNGQHRQIKTVNLCTRGS